MHFQSGKIVLWHQMLILASKSDILNHLTAAIHNEQVAVFLREFYKPKIMLYRYQLMIDGQLSPTTHMSLLGHLPSQNRKLQDINFVLCRLIQKWRIIGILWIKMTWYWIEHWHEWGRESCICFSTSHTQFVTPLFRKVNVLFKFILQLRLLF